MKTNKRLERYFNLLKYMEYMKQFIPSQYIILYGVSKNVTRALLELNLIKKVPNKRDHIYIGKKPTKQMAQMLIDKVNLYYKHNKFISEINKYNEQKGGILDMLAEKNNNSNVKIINETKEQPYLLSFTWVETQKIKSLWREKIIKNYAVSNALVYATDYNNACEKLKLEYKDFEIIHIKDLAIR